MPTLSLDSRFAGSVKHKVEELKADLKKHFTDRLGDKYEITQQVITHGRPTLGMPEIKPELNHGVFVIRTSVKFPESDIEFVKEKLGEK